MALSKSKQKLYSSLQQKKFRDREHQYIIEGKKIVSEAIEQCPNNIIEILYSPDFSNHIPHSLQDKSIQISIDEIKKISALKSPQSVLAIMAKPETNNIESLEINDLILVLDNISDPGNMGTIIRLCDWFNIRNIVCSPNCVDIYNPKVVQASMGSIFRCNILYGNILLFIEKALRNNIPAYGTTLDGNNIYQETLITPSLLVLGNESVGVSESVKDILTKNLLIPMFSGTTLSGESLNVSTAASIAISEFRRQQFYSK